MATCPAAIEDAPHAPWWGHEGLAGRFDGFAVNPHAEVLGYLYEFADETDTDGLALRDELTPLVTEDLLARGTRSMSFWAANAWWSRPACPMQSPWTATLAVAHGRKRRRHRSKRVERLRLAAIASCAQPHCAIGYSPVPSSAGKFESCDPEPRGRRLLVSRLVLGRAESRRLAGSRRNWRGVLTLERLKWLHAYDRIEPAWGPRFRRMNLRSSGQAAPAGTPCPYAV